MKIRDDIILYGKLAQQKLGYVAGQVEVTSKCFQHCKYCLSWVDKSQGKEFTLNQLIQFVVKLRRNFPMFEHLTLTGGDPQAWSCIDAFLDWWQEQDFNIDLQISTALAEDVRNLYLWRTAIKDLRVSIDASNDETYQKMRGDKNNTVGIILARLIALKHPNLAIITTMYPDNIGELLPLLFTLDNLYRKGLPLRKIIVMAGIGVHLGAEFWSCWKQTKQWAELNMQVTTSFADDIIATRAMCKSSTTDKVRCWASKLGFHVKPNGDIYPCCLVGGEAVEVQKRFKMGNVFEDELLDIYKFHEMACYGCEPICKKICQFKQLQINLAGELANKVRLAIP